MKSSYIVYEVKYAKNSSVLDCLRVSLIILRMNNIDDYFQEVAFSMGYKVEDLLPIDRRVI